MKTLTALFLIVLDLFYVVSSDLCEAQSFTRIQNGPVVSAGGDTIGIAWGDYDGDGNIDLAMANRAPSNFLFRNTGNGEFTRVEGNRSARYDLEQYCLGRFRQ